MARGDEEWAGQRLGRTPSAGMADGLHGLHGPATTSLITSPHHVPFHGPHGPATGARPSQPHGAHAVGWHDPAHMGRDRGERGRDDKGTWQRALPRVTATPVQRLRHPGFQVDGFNDDASRCRVTAGAHDSDLMRKTTPPPRAKETAVASILEGGSELWGHECVGPAAQRGRTKRCHVLCATVPVCATCVSRARE